MRAGYSAGTEGEAGDDLMSSPQALCPVGRRSSSPPTRT